MRPRDYIAKDLREGTKYRQRVVPLKKRYDRAKAKDQFRKGLDTYR